MINTAIHRLKAQWRKAISAIAVMALVAMGTSAFADDAVRQGSFKGLSNHATSGTVTLVRVADSYVIELGADFVFDGAPDPKVAFGKDGQYDPATLIELLRANSGAQSYVVPTTINPEDFNEIYIWCEKYSVGLGVAVIK
ncbi:MAG: hypothetical protein ACJAZF_000347 [Granulosicoccus sp.]|jgi:hypothetical protein